MGIAEDFQEPVASQIPGTKVEPGQDLGMRVGILMGVFPKSAFRNQGGPRLGPKQPSGNPHLK